MNWTRSPFTSQLRLMITFLYSANIPVQNDHTEVVKQFLEIRPSLVSSTTKDGNTLAHLAAKKGSVDVLQV